MERPRRKERLAPLTLTYVAFGATVDPMMPYNFRTLGLVIGPVLLCLIVATAVHAQAGLNRAAAATAAPTMYVLARRVGAIPYVVFLMTLFQVKCRSQAPTAY